MNLHQLDYFVTLAHVQHYTRAAKALMITQPSLSHSISNLEEELGTKLFEKAGRNVILTKYGEEFLECAEKTLSTLNDGIRRIRSMTGEDEGRIDLGFIYTRGSEFVPHVVKHFQNENPERHVNFTFANGSTAGMIEGLKNKKLDVAFCSRLENEKSIEYTPVSEEKLVAVVPVDHELADRTSVTLRELGQYPQIGFTQTSGLYNVISELYENAGIKPNVIYELEEDTALAGMVSYGFGVAIMPHIPNLENMKLKVIPIENMNYRRYIYMAVLKNRYLPPMCMDFIEFMKKNYDLSDK